MSRQQVQLISAMRPWFMFQCLRFQGAAGFLFKLPLIFTRLETIDLAIFGGSKGKGRDNESHSSLDTLMSHGDGLFSRLELCLWQAVIICELRHEVISTHKSVSGIGF